MDGPAGGVGQEQPPTALGILLGAGQNLLRKRYPGQQAPPVVRPEERLGLIPHQPAGTLCESIVARVKPVPYAAPRRAEGREVGAEPGDVLGVSKELVMIIPRKSEYARPARDDRGDTGPAVHGRRSVVHQAVGGGDAQTVHASYGIDYHRDGDGQATLPGQTAQRRIQRAIDDGPGSWRETRVEEPQRPCLPAGGCFGQRT